MRINTTIQRFKPMAATSFSDTDRATPAKVASNPRARAARRSAAPRADAALTLTQAVTDRLRGELLEGRFSPDEKLHEESLSATLSVSRTPLRAALNTLAAEGLLEYVPNRGYSVRGVDLDHLTSLFDVRSVLEGLAAKLAAERGMTQPMLDAFRASLIQGDRVIAKGRLLKPDRVIFSEVNACIHAAVHDAAGNRMLHDMIRLCHSVPVSSDRNILWDDYDWLRRSHDDHHRLFDAISHRDGSRAEQLMREHIHTVKLRLLDRLEPGIVRKPL
jgi:GntR family transcriptional regulator of vanillate catabolism